MNYILILLVGLIGVTSLANVSTTYGDRLPASKVFRATSSPIKFDYTIGDIDRICKNSARKLKRNLKAATSLLEIEDAIARFDKITYPFNLLASVLHGKALRKEADKCKKLVKQTYLEIYSDSRLFEIVKSFDPANDETDLRLRNNYLDSFKKNGMSLSESDVKTFISLSSRLTEVENIFRKNLDEHTDYIDFSKDELSGMSDEFLRLNAKNRSSKVYKIRLDSDNFTEIMNKAQNPETRRKMLSAWENRGGNENLELLTEALSLRRRIAIMLGYKHWADFQTSGQMAKSAEAATELLLKLHAKAQNLAHNEFASLLKLKQSEGSPEATELEPWDISYYRYQFIKSKYQLDSDEVRQYFPLNTVTRGMFDIFSTIFKIEIEEVIQASVWDSEVKLFQIKDQATDQAIAYFYMDVFPRENKYKHTAAFTLRRGRRLSSGDYQLPISAMVANFPLPTEGKPSLLNHSDVETLFHEFGHLLHNTLSTVKYSSLAGSSVPRDIVEAPSQLFELWAWDSQMLKKISGKWDNPSEPLTDDLINKMIATRDSGMGYTYLLKIVKCLTDLNIHSDIENINPNDVYYAYWNAIIPIKITTAANYMASFRHMMGSYTAGYYSYIWSEVFAEDIFTLFKNGGMLNPTLGMHYRNTILSSGNTKEPIQSLTEFLGRTPNMDALLQRFDAAKESHKDTN